MVVGLVVSVAVGVVVVKRTTLKTTLSTSDVRDVDRRFFDANQIINEAAIKANAKTNQCGGDHFAAHFLQATRADRVGRDGDTVRTGSGRFVVGLPLWFGWVFSIGFGESRAGGDPRGFGGGLM